MHAAASNITKNAKTFLVWYVFWVEYVLRTAGKTSWNFFFILVINTIQYLMHLILAIEIEAFKYLQRDSI